MDVRCARCGTEYEFDDALVSERGTTVKCTNCGHQFKVYAGARPGGGPEKWVVRKASGRELVYTSLRDLQRAIAQRQVGPSDLLSRTGSALRPLSSIAELEPFFQSQRPAPVVPGASSTLLGMSPAGVSRPPPAAPPSPEVGAAPAPDLHAAPQSEPATVRRNPMPHLEGGGPALEGPVARAPAVPAAASEPAPISSQGRRVLTPTPSAQAGGFLNYDESLSDPRYIPGGPSRSSRAKWIVGLIVLGAVVFLGATVGRKYLARFTPTSAQPSPGVAPDARVAAMLKAGSEALSAGDLEGAKEQFDKATVLAEHDPAVLAAIARLAATRADIHWLALQIIDDDDDTTRAIEKKQLARRVEQAEEATRNARAAGTEDQAVLRAQVDTYRLKGELDKARELVSSLSPSSSEPETAYVLAALDMAEPNPVWNTVIDRLRTAAGVEGEMGRARAALVVALAKAGQASQAQRELDKLAAAENPHPLLPRLKAFVESIPRDAGASGQTESDEAIEDGVEPGAPERSGTTRDFRRLLEDASRAKKAGDLDRAERLYRAARDQQPDNVEALAGLGDIARLRGDETAAARSYDAVVKANPNFLPALVARAEQKWASGDRAGAIVLYRQVLQKAGTGSPYGQKAQARISEFQSSLRPGAQEAPEQPAPPAEPAQPAPPQEPERPHIDTTDLPEFQQ